MKYRNSVSNGGDEHLVGTSPMGPTVCDKGPYRNRIKLDACSILLRPAPIGCYVWHGYPTEQQR